MIEGVMKEGFITTSYDSVVNWAKTGSLWPMTFGPVSYIHLTLPTKRIV